MSIVTQFGPRGAVLFDGMYKNVFIGNYSLLCHRYMASFFYQQITQPNLQQNWKLVMSNELGYRTDACKITSNINP